MTICINFVEIILPKTFSGDTDYRAENVSVISCIQKVVLYETKAVFEIYCILLRAGAT
jgi:hypothetical protein